jgi:hypothetical protein
LAQQFGRTPLKFVHLIFFCEMKGRGRSLWKLRRSSLEPVSLADLSVLAFSRRRFPRFESRHLSQIVSSIRRSYLINLAG